MAELNTGELCRICLKESNFFSNIFNEQLLDGTLIFEIVNDLLQLDIEFEDDYPPYLCSECYNKISEFELFKRTAHEGQNVLLYSDGSVEKNDIEFEDEIAACGRSVAAQNEVYLVPVKVEDCESVPVSRDPLEHVAVDDEIDSDHHNALLPKNYQELRLQKMGENEEGRSSQETNKIWDWRLPKKSESESQRMLEKDWNITKFQQNHIWEQLESRQQNRIENEAQKTKELQESRLPKMREYKMQNRSKKTTEHWELRLQQRRAYKRKKLRETEGKRELRLQKGRDYIAKRRLCETKDQWEMRLQKMRDYCKPRSSQETEEKLQQWESMLQKMRESNERINS